MVRDCSLVGRYFYILYIYIIHNYIVKRLKVGFSLIIYVHANIILDVPITYINDSVLCQSEYACLYEINENIYPKGWALMQIYRVVPITKRGNWAMGTLHNITLDTKHKHFFTLTKICFCIWIVMFTRFYQTIYFLTRLLASYYKQP